YYIVYYKVEISWKIVYYKVEISWKTDIISITIQKGWNNMQSLISREILDELSYTSRLGRSLKQISLRQTPLELILEDIGRYRANYIDTLIQENLIGSRFKSDDSIMRKYKKTLRTNGGFKQCFNDVLGFRLKMDEYPVNYPEYFRVVDLRQGKKVDDGYRAIHLYYQRDNLAYPIEIQLWCGADYYFNVWSHQHLYKYKDPELGKLLYKEYQSGQIKSETDFLARMEAMERNG
ncbi:hypothetical protein DW058_16810, partial [Clostridiaceae bacterium AF42-6]